MEKVKSSRAAPGASAHLWEQEIELFARAMVSPLRQEEFDLLLDLLLVQMPAVLIVHACPRRGVRGPWFRNTQPSDQRTVWWCLCWSEWDFHKIKPVKRGITDYGHGKSKPEIIYQPKFFNAISAINTEPCEVPWWSRGKPPRTPNNGWWFKHRRQCWGSIVKIY